MARVAKIQEALTLAEVSQLLWATQEITDPEGKRTTPSAGALYPLEWYLVTARGVAHFEPRGHQLTWTLEGDVRRALEAAAYDLGFKAVITCVDSSALDRSFAGRVFDRQFLADLPSSVDPSRENGEFHSFVYDGPIFRRKIRCEKGEVVLRDNRFYYCDLKPVERQVRANPEKVGR